MTGRRRRETGADTSCGGVGRTVGSDGASILFSIVNYQNIVVCSVHLTITVDVRSSEPKLACLAEVGEEEVVVKYIYLAIFINVTGIKYPSWNGGGSRRGKRYLGSNFGQIYNGWYRTINIVGNQIKIGG